MRRRNGNKRRRVERQEQARERQAAYDALTPEERDIRESIYRDSMTLRELAERGRIAAVKLA